MRRRTVLVAAVAALALAASGCGAERDEAQRRVEWSALAEDEAATFEYVIPYGTGVALDNGQTVDIMPAALEARVGDSIRIVNKDYRAQEVGPFYVRANQTLAMRFTRPGTLIGTCAISDEGEIVITVTE